MARRKAPRVFSKEFKLEVLREIDAGVSVAQAARNHEVHPETIRLWRRTEKKYGERAFAGNGHAYTDEAHRAARAGAGAGNAGDCVAKKTLSVLKEQDRRSGRRRCLREYADFEAARRSIARFLDVTYNERRLHSALDYRPPAEFEARPG